MGKRPPEDAAESGDPARLRERWLRAAAEAENLRKRLWREVDEARRSEREAALREVLEIADSLDLAAEPPETPGAGEPPPAPEWTQAARALRDQALAVLRRLGAEPQEPLGERFDPNEHDAVAAVERGDVDPGTVVDVVRRGYSMNDGRLLRPARVVVSRAPGTS